MEPSSYVERYLYSLHGISEEIASLYMNRWREITEKPMSRFEKMISDFLVKQNVDFIFQFPVFDVDGSFFFVDFYLTDYNLVIDIPLSKNSPYYNKRRWEERVNTLSNRGPYYFVPLFQLMEGKFTKGLSEKIKACKYMSKSEIDFYRKNNKRKKKK